MRGDDCALFGQDKVNKTLFIYCNVNKKRDCRRQVFSPEFPIATQLEFGVPCQKNSILLKSSFQLVSILSQESVS